jgi:NADH dehydrogenase
VRERVLQLYADANAKPELVDDGALTFVVVGGGPTGVEISGALSDLVLTSCRTATRTSR